MLGDNGTFSKCRKIFDEAPCPIVNESGKINRLAMLNDRINRGSYKRAFLFLNLLDESGKKIGCKASPSTYRFSTSSFINSLTMIQKDECRILFII